MRFTEHKETPLSRATSALAWPAFNKISTSCLFNILSILLPPAPPAHSRVDQGEFYPLLFFRDGSEFPEGGGSEFVELTNKMNKMLHTSACSRDEAYRPICYKVTFLRRRPAL
jgi:hypothetical protein